MSFCIQYLSRFPDGSRSNRDLNSFLEHDTGNHRGRGDDIYHHIFGVVPLLLWGTVWGNIYMQETWHLLILECSFYLIYCVFAVYVYTFHWILDFHERDE